MIFDTLFSCQQQQRRLAQRLKFLLVLSVKRHDSGLFAGVTFEKRLTEISAWAALLLLTGEVTKSAYYSNLLLNLLDLLKEVFWYFMQLIIKSIFANRLFLQRFL